MEQRLYSLILTSCRRIFPERFLLHSCNHSLMSPSNKPSRSERSSSTLMKLAKRYTNGAGATAHCCPIALRKQKKTLVRLFSDTVGSLSSNGCLNTSCDSRVFDTHEKLISVSPENIEINNFFTDIRHQIVFEDDHVLAVNKPYGLSVYGQKANDVSLKKKLPHIADELQCSGLDIGTSLKRYHRGVLVLTKNETAAKDLSRFLKYANAQKICFMTFLAITAGTPQCQRNEDIELLIQRDFLHDREMSVISEKTMSKKTQKSLRDQGTLIKVKYNVEVLAESSRTQSALVQVKVNKYKWDACELFFSHFLSPVLGDNVYASRTHYVMGIPFPAPPQVAAPGPQRLPAELAHALNHENSDSHPVNLPLFLHLQKVTLSRFPTPSSQSFDISAQPSETFIKALKVLGLHKQLDFKHGLIL